jgi:hypothetical protein
MDSLWLEVAVVALIFAIGSVYFGHFEERTPKWRKILKLAFVIAVVVGLSSTLGRAWAFGFIALLLLFVAFVHGVVLPRNGINGLTGEPRDKYYEFRGWTKKE